METVLLHQNLLADNNAVKSVFSNGLTNPLRILSALHDAGITIYGPSNVAALHPHVKDLTHGFHHEYSAPSLTVTSVEEVEAAIDHIHKHGTSIYFCLFSYHQEAVILNQSSQNQNKWQTYF